MRSWMMAISMGIGVVGWLPALPTISVIVGLSIAIVLVLIPSLVIQRCWHLSSTRYFHSLLSFYTHSQWFKTGALFFVGIVWASCFGYRVINWQLDSALENKNIVVQGVIVGLPNTSIMHGKPVQRFDFKLTRNPRCVHAEKASGIDCANGLKKLKLKWYGKATIKPGQYWRFVIKAKRPFGMANPGGFDYQSWLIAQGIGAVGYVLDSGQNQQLDDSRWHIDRLRWQWSKFIDDNGSELQHRALIKALLIGDKRDISDSQWNLFAATGTTHLMVISGLHVGLISALVLFISRAVLLLLFPRCRVERWAAIAAFTVALGYALAAGLTLPTQRALIMICVYLLVVFFNRYLAPSQGLQTALLACLLFDPLAPMSMSFWLSFTAVAFIFYASAGRFGHTATYKKHFFSQYIVFIGLLPVLAIVLGRVSLLSPIANMIAVPIFSMLIVPINFLALIVVVVNEALALVLWRFVDVLLEYNQLYLQLLANHFSALVIHVPHQPVMIKALAIVAVLLLLLPKGVPLRHAGLLLLLPIFIVPPQRPSAGDVWLTVLDVGQGLSVVVQTTDFNLVYDTGPKLGPHLDAAKMAVLPFLYHQGINRIDRLVISHADTDHAGGLATLLTNMQVEQLSVGEKVWPIKMSTSKELPLNDSTIMDSTIKTSPIPANTQFCKAGEQWLWNGVKFEYIYPKGGNSSNDIPFFSGNDASCVLKISSGDISFLLPGDIGQSAEMALLSDEQINLQSTVIIAPHHGSATSSSWPFIKRVAPVYVIFSSGYRNQFGHPNVAIVDRYRQLGSHRYTTSKTGSLGFAVVNSHMGKPVAYRSVHKRYWLMP